MLNTPVHNPNNNRKGLPTAVSQGLALTGNTGLSNVGMLKTMAM